MATAKALNGQNKNGLPRLSKSPEQEWDRFTVVAYVPAMRTFAVRMKNGKDYLLRLDDLAEADNSDVRTYRLVPQRTYFVVRQASGNRLEVPWDVVLYHCEPTYEYYKGRPAQQRLEKESSQRIAARVRTLRKARGLTVTALAQEAGMERPNLSRLEHGKHVPSLETLERVARTLRVRVVELVSG